MASVLFEHIEALHGEREWGDFLDAGTGVNSINWVSGLDTTRWTAVTGAGGMAQSVERAVQGKKREQDRLVLGNWQDPRFLADERFDTVLADYLLGAIDGFAPYWQDELFPRLCALTKKRLYLVGLEPYVPFDATTASGKLVVEIGRLRDACLLMAGERTYREYPSAWVERQLDRAGFEVVETKRFPIRYGKKFVEGQMKMCRQRMATIADRYLAQAMLKHVEDLERRALAHIEIDGGLSHGADYVMVAEPKKSAPQGA
ncbi:class I SAM-dependent methyltransferase [Halomonas sp. HMF6819]|uniref:class I SAM-dependent methyltransferase n=1 Tax=Halomonas sp. HMF6819 TaxID=3373085 RepID=UPI0037B035F3